MASRLAVGSLKKLTCAYSPFDGAATSIREFQVRISNARTKTGNAKLVLESNVLSAHEPPRVVAVSAKGKTLEVATAELQVEDIVATLNEFVRTE